MSSSGAHSARTSVSRDSSLRRSMTSFRYHKEFQIQKPRGLFQNPWFFEKYFFWFDKASKNPDVRFFWAKNALEILRRLSFSALRFFLNKIKLFWNLNCYVFYTFSVSSGAAGSNRNSTSIDQQQPTLTDLNNHLHLINSSTSSNHRDSAVSSADSGGPNIFDMIPPPPNYPVCLLD